MRLRARPLSVAVLGGGCLAAALLLWAPGAFNLRDDIREVMFDGSLPLLASPPETRQSSSSISTVKVWRAMALGPGAARSWRIWCARSLKRSRASLASTCCCRSRTASRQSGLLRNLGTEADRSGIADLARKLPDGDAALADALKAAPVVLGSVLEPGAGEVPPGAPILGARPAPAPRHLAGRRRDRPRARGRQPPRRGLGAMVLADDVDGRRPPRAASCPGRRPRASRLGRRGLARRL